MAGFDERNNHTMSNERQAAPERSAPGQLHGTQAAPSTTSPGGGPKGILSTVPQVRRQGRRGRKR